MDAEKKLAELKQLYEKGLISAAVYEEQQKALLSGPSGTASIDQSASTKRPSDSSSDFLDPKKNWRVVSGFLALCATVGVGIWAFYWASGQEGKDLVNRAASEAGVAARVIPWSDRAESAARQLVEANGQQLAASIQSITHPTGTGPALSSVEISKFDGRIRVELTVRWKGGFLGGEYNTTVAWDIGQTDHINAAVVADSASIPVAEQQKKALDEYFRSSVYPAFYKSVGG